MYIYLIKYNDAVIAAAEDDDQATAVIKQYMTYNRDMDMSMFEKQPIRFFAGKKDVFKCGED